MNNRIRQLAEQAGIGYGNLSTGHGDNWQFAGRPEELERFADLIVKECMKECWDEIVDDEDIAEENDPLIREYLLGNNQGIVDAVIRFRNHFGVAE
jgi:hypothetical protein